MPATSLADFLAEVTINPPTAGIVLDGRAAAIIGFEHLPR
jgi:hypothetical protein